MHNYVVQAFSEAGRKKPNQDALLYQQLDEDKWVLAIADGMGGEKGGEIASKLAIDTVAKEIMQTNSLREVFNQVKQNLVDFATSQPEYRKMGTTLTVALVQGNHVEVGHVGDTRLYHIHNNKLSAITKDQTEVQKLIEIGVLSEERAKNYPRRNVLISALTPTHSFEFQDTEFDLTHFDKLLLSTDGAYSLIEKTELEILSEKSANTNEYLQNIKTTILGRNIQDDYSMLIMQMQ